MPGRSSVTDAGHKGTGRNGPNARHLLQLAAALISLVPLENLLFHLRHVAIQVFDVS